MAEKITARLQSPADSSGTRNDIHLVNTTDEVIVDYDSTDVSKARKLTQKLQEMRTVISNNQPTQSSGFKSSFLWAQIITTPPTMATINSWTKGTGMNTSIEDD